MKAKTIILFMLAVIVPSGATYILTNGSHATAGANKESVAAEKPKGISITDLKTQPAVIGEGWDVVKVNGKIGVPADKLVRVSTRIEGKVVAAYGKPGDSVRQGQALAVISSMELAEARSQYREADASLDASKKRLQQELEMVNIGANSIRPLEEAQADSLEARGNLADAKSEIAQVKSELVQADSELAQCKSRLERSRELYADKIISRQDIESTEAECKRDEAAVDAVKSKASQAEARVETAKSKLAIAAEYLAREQKVYNSKMVDSRALQAAKSEVTSAQIQLRAAADRIRVLGADPKGTGETVSVICPISGRIVSRNFNVGETVSPTDALYSIANLSSVLAEASVYEKDIARIRIGQAVEIQVEAYPNKVFSGRVDSISDILSSDSRTANVRCVIANPQGILKSEMFATISLVTSKRGSTVLIPKEAILNEAGKNIVFTPCMECPEDQKAGTNACGAYDKLNVKTGAAHGNQVEILSGVEPGVLVVTQGGYQIMTALGSGQLEAGCTGH